MVATATSRAPSVPAGVVQESNVGLWTTTLVAAAPPMVTPVPPGRKFVPVMLIVEPPTVGPAAGKMDEMPGRPSTGNAICCWKYAAPSTRVPFWKLKSPGFTSSPLTGFLAANDVM